jgi:L-lactate dehydrogenase complex protein LldG
MGEKTEGRQAMSAARTRILAKLPVTEGARHDPGREFDPRPRLLRGMDRTRLLETFRDRVVAAAGTVADIGSRANAPEEVRRYMEQHALPATLRLAPEVDDLAAALPATLRVTRGANRDDVVTVLSVAYAGIAETGSIVMVSGGNTPASLNYLPDAFLVLLDTRPLLATMEDLWERLRNDRAHKSARSVNIITGPSRTADVEQIIQLGAHGPRQLHVLLYED